MLVSKPQFICQKFRNYKASQKDKAIIKEFLNDKGIIVVPVHDNSNAFEAFNRECLMIECVGLNKLCNKYKGTSYNLKKWKPIKRKNFGLMVIYCAYKRYIIDINEWLMPIKMGAIVTVNNNKK